MSEIFIIIAVTAVALYWLAAMRCKEIATGAARRECQRHDVQFLDQTVHQIRISLSRDASNSWRVWREYRFEYSDDGEHRHAGRLVLLGQKVRHVALETFNPIIH